MSNYRFVEAQTSGSNTWYRLEVNGSIEPEDPNRPCRLLDPSTGSLVESSGDTLIFYPSAELDSNRLIQNNSGTGWVVQSTGWAWADEPAFFALMAEAADPDHPIWEGAVKSGYEEHREAPRKSSAKTKDVTPSEAVDQAVNKGQ